MTDILDFLQRHAIAFERFDHPPVFTSEQARGLPPMPGAPARNLFLRDKAGKRFFLLVIDDRRRVDLKTLGESMGTSRLSLASPRRLKEILGIEPGAVSVLALINDPARLVEVWIDRAIWQSEAVQCHPLVNTATFVLSQDGMRAFLQATGHMVRVIDLASI